MLDPYIAVGVRGPLRLRLVADAVQMARSQLSADEPNPS